MLLPTSLHMTLSHVTVLCHFTLSLPSHFTMSLSHVTNDDISSQFDIYSEDTMKLNWQLI